MSSKKAIVSSAEATKKRDRRTKAQLAEELDRLRDLHNRVALECLHTKTELLDTKTELITAQCEVNRLTKDVVVSRGDLAAAKEIAAQREIYHDGRADGLLDALKAALAHNGEGHRLKILVAPKGGELPEDFRTMVGEFLSGMANDDPDGKKAVGRQPIR